MPRDLRDEAHFRGTTIRSAIKGATFKGGNVTGKAGLAEYHAFDSKVPADVKDAVSKVVADLKSGALQTGVKLG